MSLIPFGLTPAQFKANHYRLDHSNAASAGALIAISCDSIYMRHGAAIGAASVVNQKR